MNTSTARSRERKAPGDVLRGKDAFLQSVVNTAVDGIITISSKGIITTSNNAAARIFGYGASEIIGQDVKVLMPEPYHTERHHHVADYLQTDEGKVIGRGREVLGRRKDGTIFPLDLAIAEFQFDGERHFTGTVRDISDRKYLEERLVREGRFNRMMMEALPGIVFLFDADQNMLKWNKEAERVSGYAAEEIVRMSPLDFVDREDRQAVADAVRDVLLNGQSCVEARLQTKAGQRISYFISGARWLTESGPQILGVGVDVTARRQLEEQLRQSQKMEAFGQLAGGLAHDFNNLLTIISGCSDLMLSMLPAQDSMRELVTAISDAGERAAALTRQMLAFGRQTVLAPRVLDLNAAVDETQRMLRRLIGEDICLTSVLDPEISRIRADPGHLGQVLINLALNARDAMPRGGTLTIETSNVVLDENYAATHCEIKAGDYVMLAVRDTGCGMSPQVQARIFEPFFTTKGVGKGTGLGLAVMHGIVQQSGGSIELQSGLGSGTTFKLYFPAVRDAEVVPNKPSVGTAARGTETVLVVEDDAGVRGIVLSALQKHGYTVWTASGGTEALGLAEEHGDRISLLITDVVMPGMGGGELAEVMQARFPKMRVLFLSGYRHDAVVRQGIQYEHVEFLQKPFSPASLARKVRELLDE